METPHYPFEEKPIIVPTREHASLEAFVGKWAIEGQSFAYSADTSPSKIKGIVSYEWLVGGFFLCYKWDRYFDFENHQGLGIISHDENAHSFAITNYDSQGNIKSYQISHAPDTWKFKGEKERATFKFDTDSFTETWEILIGKTWKPLCEIKARKIE
ncbi:DUF1579 family protein [Pedobacter sp. KR3-3]|uniref:DUF1579 family protein n=1 Tax=Pedobacter albus TaxID=3113905 RepID=A0ABU7I851_9SPHI|nr:DUF1579 family protein [Pedobacter sp. KR3-3]MEE1945399.1 DUF1579 family protein [Pedobacter sp. KR3-3]